MYHFLKDKKKDGENDWLCNFYFRHQHHLELGQILGPHASSAESETGGGAQQSVF